MKLSYDAKANQQLADDHGRLIVETGGKRQEIALAA